MADDWWNARASNILRGEVKRAGMTYRDLAAALRLVGAKETTNSVRNKLSRGTFSFSFALQCLHVLGREDLDVRLMNAPTRKEKPNDDSSTDGKRKRS